MGCTQLGGCSTAGMHVRCSSVPGSTAVSGSVWGRGEVWLGWGAVSGGVRGRGVAWFGWGCVDGGAS